MTALRKSGRSAAPQNSMPTRRWVLGKAILLTTTLMSGCGPKSDSKTRTLVLPKFSDHTHGLQASFETEVRNIQGGSAETIEGLLIGVRATFASTNNAFETMRRIVIDFRNSINSRNSYKEARVLMGENMAWLNLLLVEPLAAPPPINLGPGQHWGRFEEAIQSFQQLEGTRVIAFRTTNPLTHRPWDSATDRDFAISILREVYTQMGIAIASFTVEFFETV